MGGKGNLWTGEEGTGRKSQAIALASPPQPRTSLHRLWNADGAKGKAGGKRQTRAGLPGTGSREHVAPNHCKGVRGAGADAHRQKQAALDEKTGLLGRRGGESRRAHPDGSPSVNMVAKQVCGRCAFLTSPRLHP